MQLPLSPFRKSVQTVPTRPRRPVPIQAARVTTQPLPAKSQRRVTIVHPERSGAYRLKSKLLSGGHRRVETFFSPASLLAVLRYGHRPDVIIIDDFSADTSGMNAIELVWQLRTEHQFTGLLYASSLHHAGLADEKLQAEGFSGHFDSYLGN